ncbi:uncharacterized protein [Oscarella lobularis]|uniref:uncharacterized protein n=1 Tax=Oscarella lobularis TaxID=121494 RepID=UPI0033138C85
MSDDLNLGRGYLVCEGYLVKRRGALQNRTRWFRLTTTYLEYYTEEEGDLINSLPLSTISGVTEEGSTQFKIAQREPMEGSERTRMLLDAKTVPEKRKWTTKLLETIRLSHSPEENLICEGPLTKLRFANRLRWFCLTNRTLAYFTENGGRLLAEINLENIEAIKSIDNLTFVVHGDYEFTASKKRDMTLRSPNETVKRKWMRGFKRLQEIGRIRVKY